MISKMISPAVLSSDLQQVYSLSEDQTLERGVNPCRKKHSAFMSYIEWGSRLAVENSASAAHPPLHMPMPRWDWGTAGPPGSRVSALAPVQEEEKTVALPSADEAVRFSLHIKPLFRPMDRQSMKWAFDLWSYQDAKSHAAGILQRWVESGMQE